MPRKSTRKKKVSEGGHGTPSTPPPTTPPKTTTSSSPSPLRRSPRQVTRPPPSNSRTETATRITAAAPPQLPPRRPTKRINWDLIAEVFNNAPSLESPPFVPAPATPSTSKGRGHPPRKSTTSKKSNSTTPSVSPSKSPQRKKSRIEEKAETPRNRRNASKSPSISPTNTIPMKKRRRGTGRAIDFESVQTAPAATATATTTTAPRSEELHLQMEVEEIPVRSPARSVRVGRQQPGPSPRTLIHAESGHRSPLSTGIRMPRLVLSPIRRQRPPPEETEEEIAAAAAAAAATGSQSRPSDSQEQRPEIPPSTDPRDIDYSVWTSNKWFIPGEERPKVKKVKGSIYNYEKLGNLEDQLKILALEQHKAGQKPLLMLKEQRFVYGVVVEIRPPRDNEYRINICDETRDDEGVLVRICTWPTEQEKGPEIQMGDVIRIHRVTVQGEYNTVRDKTEMVISTAPHWNYVVFRLTADGIVYNTLAKNITLNDEKDIPRVHELLDYAKRRVPSAGNGDMNFNDEEHGFMFESWDGNTTSQTLEVQLGRNSRNPDRVLSSTPLPPSPAVSSRSSATSQVSSGFVPRNSGIVPPSPSVSPLRGTGASMNRGGGGNTRRQFYSPNFHVTPPPYPT